MSATNIHIVKTDGAGNPLAAMDFGGSAVDTPLAAATDPQGNLIVVGSTSSPDFPLVSPVLKTGQAFATKIDSQLGKILFSTLLGTTGSGIAPPQASGVAVDTSGNIYITGSTGSGFPTTAGSLQAQAPVLSQQGTIEHGFLMELTPAGDRVVFATYFSGSGFACFNRSNPCLIMQAIDNFSPPVIYTTPTAIAVDSAGQITIAGTTNSNNLPASTDRFAAINGNNLIRWHSLPDKRRAALKLVWGEFTCIHATPSACARLDSRRLPSDTINGLALDSLGNVVFTGVAAAGFPISPGALQTAFPSGSDILYGEYVAKLNSSGSNLAFSTWFGSAGALATARCSRLCSDR